MVDNRPLSPVSGSYFKQDNALTNKMSDEKYGQGGEYYATETELQEEQKETYQDRSAQLRASLNGLAIANVGMLKFKKAVDKKEDEENNKRKKEKRKKDEEKEK